MDIYFNVLFKNKTAGNAHAFCEVSIPHAIVATLYWATDNGQPLEDYLPICSYPLFNGKTEFFIREDLMIPEKATHLLLRAFNDSMLEIVLPEMLVEIPAEKRLKEEAPQKVIFAASDMHFGGDYFHNPACRKRAFETIRDVNPDVVVVAGDVTDNSYPNEYAQATEYIEAYLPSTPVFVTFGNHDYSPYAKGSFPHYDDMLLFMQNQIKHNEALGIEMTPLTERNTYAARIDGISFIMLNPNEENRHYEYREDQLKWFDEQLSLSDGDRFRVVTTHFHRYNTVSVPRRKTPVNVPVNDDKCGEIIDRHRNIIHISGHSHYNMDDNDMVSAKLDEKHNVLYSNGGCMVWTGVAMNERPEYYQKDRAMGQIIEVYSDHIIVRGVEYVSGKYISRCIHYVNM